MKDEADRLQSVLQGSLSDVEAERQRLVDASGGRRKFPPWYSFYGGPRNLYELAKDLDRLDNTRRCTGGGGPRASMHRRV